MTVRDEIKDVILRAACRVLENVRGELSETEQQTLRTNLEERIPRYTGSYPILGLLDEIQSAADAGHAATVATNTAIKRQLGEPNLGWDESLGKFSTPISDQWRQAIQESAAEATKDHFHMATTFFEEGERVQATEHLCSAIICSIAAIAALLGWPHSDGDDDLRVMVGLATGSLPAEATASTGCCSRHPNKAKISTARSQPQWASRQPSAAEPSTTLDETLTKPSCSLRPPSSWPTNWARGYDDADRTAGGEQRVCPTVRPRIRPRRQRHDCRRISVGSRRPKPACNSGDQ